MDGLSHALFRALRENWSHGVETAVNVALLGRCYERFVDHVLAIAQAVIFMVTSPGPHIEHVISAEAAVRAETREATADLPSDEADHGRGETDHGRGEKSWTRGHWR